MGSDELIADLMLMNVINDVGDLLYLFLIGELIKVGKIQILEKKENHFADVIGINFNKKKRNKTYV